MAGVGAALVACADDDLPRSRPVRVLPPTEPSGAALDVSVAPERPTPLDTLSCAWSGTDRARVRWEVDGVSVGEGATLVASGYGGRRVRCVVVPDDPGLRSGFAEVTVDEAPPANLLLVVADDLGPADLGIYGKEDVPRTPAIDTLASRGVTFLRAYANPICSATRATLQTGRYGFRTGITTIVLPRDTVGLELDEVTLPEVLRERSATPYDAAFFGKWHLAGGYGRSHPNDSGWPWFQGKFVCFLRDQTGQEETYWSWDKLTNGVVTHEDRYATTVTVDDALAHLPSLVEPWVMVVAFNAPHQPLHYPPHELWSGRPVGDTVAIVQYHAMIEALDTELARLLRGLGDATDRTNVVFLSDNGPWAPTATDPVRPGQAKGTVYEGGTRVPLIVAGPAVVDPGRTSDALVQSVDVFATMADLGNVPRAALADLELDGTSFLPVLREPDRDSDRAYVYTEHLSPAGREGWTQGGRAIQDERWKLMQDVVVGTEVFTDLQGQWVEAVELTEPLTTEQREALERLRAAWPFEVP
jgi:arylsulfatase A-like enzyme